MVHRERSLAFSFRPQKLLLTGLQVVTDLLERFCVIDNLWGEKNEEIGPCIGFGAVPEERPDNRDRPEERNTLIRVLPVFLDDTADHDGLVIPHPDRRLR